MAAATGGTRDAAVSRRYSVQAAADAGFALALALVAGSGLPGRFADLPRAAASAFGRGRGKHTTTPSAAAPSAARPGGGPDPEGGRQPETRWPVRYELPDG